MSILNKLGAGLVAIFVCLYIVNELYGMEASTAIWICGVLLIVLCVILNALWG
jgi:hypothetical protein